MKLIKMLIISNISNSIMKILNIMINFKIIEYKILIHKKKDCLFLLKNLKLVYQILDIIH